MESDMRPAISVSLKVLIAMGGILTGLASALAQSGKVVAIVAAHLDGLGTLDAVRARGSASLIANEFASLGAASMSPEGCTVSVGTVTPFLVADEASKAIACVAQHAREFDLAIIY